MLLAVFSAQKFNRESRMEMLRAPARFREFSSSRGKGRNRDVRRCAGTSVESGVFEKKYNVAHAAYIHVPFCRRRCFYCDFAVSIVGDNKSRWEKEHYKYLDLLLQEIKATPREYASKLKTIFFGGGTPSLAPPDFIKEVIAALRSRYGIEDDAEISMEMDPGTFNLEKLKGFIDAGVTRVSLGVQVFDEDRLSAIGRAHSLKDVYDAVGTLERAGVENFSLDLISGLPNQTIASWEETVRTAIQQNPAHISTYDLMIEQSTAFERRGLRPGEPPLPSEEDTMAMYRLAQQLLTDAGYKHYELSNYAKPGFECAHNRVYWENQPFLGLGMGAASYLKDKRFTRPRRLVEYEEFVHTLTEATKDNEDGWSNVLRMDDKPWSEENWSTDEQEDINREKLTDVIMLGLRLAEGIDLQEIKDNFGAEIVTKILKGVENEISKGQVIVEPPSSFHKEDYAEPRRLRLADPEGFLVSSDVISTIFASI